MLSLDDVLAAVALASIVTLAAYKLRALSGPGAVSAFLLSSAIGILGGLGWLALLVAFLVLGSVLTKYKYSVKSRRGVSQKKKGKRSWNNVLANGGIPLIIAVASFFARDTPHHGFLALLFVVSLASATADTAASELGVLHPKAYMITTLKRVKPGVDGGISSLGQTVALMAALVISVLGLFLVIEPGMGLSGLTTLLFSASFGFLGCQIDSLLGATVEMRGHIGNDGVNFLSQALATGLGCTALWMWL